MYWNFDKHCREMLVASGYRFIVIGDRLQDEDGAAVFEVIPSLDEVHADRTIVFDLDSPEAIDLVSTEQPVGLFLDVRYAIARAMAA
jgi:hypothetical protein